MVLAILAAMAVAAAWLDKAGERQWAGMAQAVDGDSLVLEGDRLRLRGIDAPELEQTCGLPADSRPCGRHSRAALRALIRGKRVQCSASERDRYDRWLAVCHLGSVTINRWMVEQGWAVAYGDYEKEERIARRARRNLWESAFETPASWRQSRGSLADAAGHRDDGTGGIGHRLRSWWSALSGSGRHVQQEN